MRGGSAHVSTRWLAVLPGLIVTLAACGSGGSAGAVASPGRLYRQARAYTQCMRSHGVANFPEPRPGPGGTLIYPLNPPAGMLVSSGYDAAYRACLKLAVHGNSARYRAVAMGALTSAECMRAHGVAAYPTPATLNGGIQVPDITTPRVDPHTLQFLAAAKACHVPGAWQSMWWWPASQGQP